MQKLVTRFLSDQDGAVTVDWVVLTAAIVGMGVIVITQIGKGATDMSSGVNGHLMKQNVTTTY